MDRPGKTADRLRFGPFEVDEKARRVYKHGIPIQVRGQSFEVLLALLSRPGEIVSREDLRRRLWPEQVHVEFETALNSIVNRLRNALGDNAARPKYIETVSRIGYRFTGPPMEPGGQPQSSRPLRLVVLPIMNLSGGSGQEYLCDGLTEELISQLSVLGGRLSVLARTTSMHYKATRKSVAAITKELRADYVLEGSVRRSGEQVRVSAQLIEAAGQSHVWAKTYECGIGDLFRFQEQVASAVAREIDCAMTHQEVLPVDPRAFDAYIRGRYHAGRVDSSGLASAAECFELAISIEPRFAKAWAMLAQVWAESGFWNHAPASIAYPKAGDAAGRALSLDQSLAEAHRALGTVQWFHHWDLELCRSEYIRAVALKPSDAAARMSLATYLAGMESDFRWAHEEAELARQLDPFSALVWGASAWVHLWAREFEQAIRVCQRAIEIDKLEPRTYYVLGLSLAGMNRWDEAIEVLESGCRLECGNMMLAYLATAYAGAGDTANAERILTDLTERARTEPLFPTSIAFIHMAVGRHDAAIDWLEKAIEERDSHVLWLPTAPRWDPVRSHPRFMQLLKRVPRPASIADPRRTPAT